MGAISNKRDSKNGKTTNDAEKPKGFKAWGTNLGKFLAKLIFWSLISFGFIVSIKETRFTSLKIPDFLKDFSESGKSDKSNGSFMNIFKSFFSEEKKGSEYSPFEQWLSTIYNKTLQTNNYALSKMNDILHTIFGLSYIKLNKQSGILNNAFSVINAFLLFTLAPFFGFGYAGVTSLITFIQPFISSYKERSLLKLGNILSFIVILCLLFFFLISGIITSWSMYLLILPLLFFGPYLFEGFEMYRNILNKLPIIQDNSSSDNSLIEKQINFINMFIGTENKNFFSEFAIPVFKKVIGILINIVLIYAAATTTTYGLSSSVTIGMWIGFIILNISMITTVLATI